MKTSDREEDDLDLAGASEAGVDLVRRLEEAFDVNSLRYHGLKVWPRLRSQLVFSYMQGFYDTGASMPRSSKASGAIQRLARLSDEVIQAAKRSADEFEDLARLNAGRPLAFLGSNPRRVRFEERDWSPIFDPLIALLADDSRPFAKMIIRKPESTDFEMKAGDMIFADYDPVMALLSRIEAARSLFVLPPQVSGAGIENFDAFRAALPSPLADKLSEGAVIKDVAFIERLAIFFRIYLQKAKPPFVLLSGQKRVNMAMTLACRQLGVVSVDIQHGAAPYSPIGYKWHSWLRMPDEGYELLPDYFWVWGERPAAMISRGANRNCRYHKPIVGGHPALLTDYGDTFPKRFLSKISARRQVILATLGHLGNEGFPDNLLDAMKLAPAGWFWLLRLHPHDCADAAVRERLRERLDAAGVKNFEIDVSSSEPLPKLLQHVQWHVTPYSSSAVEATAFGVPTIFIHPLAHWVFGHMLSLNGMHYAEEPAEIVAKLTKSASKVEPLVQVDRKKAAWILTRLLARKEPFATSLKSLIRR